MDAAPQPAPSRHQLTRLRHELRRRQLQVTRVEDVTPLMRRVVLSGPELHGFHSPSPDDHVKLTVPGPAGEERRDYTPRRHDPARNELLIDFAVHEAGPATAWALAARPGDPILVAGPRGSTMLPDDFDWWLLLGDETALPAIGRRVEELSAGTPVITLVAVTAPAEEQHWLTAAAHQPVWVHRPADHADDPAPLLDALSCLSLPPGDGFIWIAAEARVARALRDHVRTALNHPAEWTKASGYWIKGTAGGHEKLDG